MIENHSIELEQRVLETLMHFGVHHNVQVQKAMLLLQSQCFYNFDNAKIFGMIRKCFKQQEPFDFVNILSSIPQDNSDLYNSCLWITDNYRNFHTGEASFEYHVDRLIILMRLRQQIKLSERMIEEVKSCPRPEDAQNILITGLQEISSLSFKESKHGLSNTTIAEDFYDGKIGEEIKIPTTCNPLNDALMGGIMPKSLVIVAAGASVGKTGFSIFLMDCIARAQADTQSLFFSIEMEYKHIWMRHVGICAGKQFDKLNYDERMTAVTESMQIPVTIYDTAMCHSAADIDFILTTARLRAMEKPVSVIVVDYLSLVETKLHFERNDLKQTYITSKLAQLAIELNCTVIALSQINRGAANRSTDDRCPWPHDAADSSGGHRSSSLWLGVDRPELYQDDPCYRNQFVVKCRKNRFGDLFELIFAFNEGTFAEVQPGWFRKPVKSSKSIDKALFQVHGKEIYAD